MQDKASDANAGNTAILTLAISYLCVCVSAYLFACVHMNAAVRESERDCRLSDRWSVMTQCRLAVCDVESRR